MAPSFGARLSILGATLAVLHAPARPAALARPASSTSSGIGDLILNGDFEDHNTSGCQTNLPNATFNATMANCTAFGFAEEIDLLDDPGGCYGLPAISGGTKLALSRSLGGAPDAFSTDLSTVVEAGKTYTVSGWAHSVLDFGGVVGSVDLGLGTATDFGTRIHTAPAPELVWTNFTHTFVAPVSATHLTVSAGIEKAWVHIDAFTLEEVVGCPATTYCDEAQNPANVADISISGCDLSPGTSVDLANGPPAQFTYLLIGDGNATVSTPPGADGDLCVLGGSCLGRYASDIGVIGAGGDFTTDISNSASGGPSFGIPTCGGTIQPGATFYFQYWHRQPMGQPSSFSSAICVTFH